MNGNNNKTLYAIKIIIKIILLLSNIHITKIHSKYIYLFYLFIQN